MPEAIAEKTGKSSAKLWKRGELKEQNLVENDDWVIPGGVSIEWTATATKMRSRKVEGTLTGSGEQHLGSSTLNASGYIIRDTGTTSGSTSNVILESTSTETAKVETGAKEIKAQLKVNSGKYIQGETVKTSGNLAIKGSSTWETNALELATAGELEALETSTLKAGGSTVKGTSIRLGTSGPVEDNASTNWEPTAAGGVFNGGGHSFNGIVKLLGKQEVTGANTFAKLQINNKGAAAAAGIKLKKGETQTVTAKGLTTNGTEAEPARIESTVAGETATLETSGETTGWLKLKDITTPAGPWYLPHGSEEGGNVHTIGTTIKFEAEPAGEETPVRSAPPLRRRLRRHR